MPGYENIENVLPDLLSSEDAKRLRKEKSVINTLEKLQYESGKSIGVISHVEAMQERITTQIRVSKNGQGYSRIEVR